MMKKINKILMILVVFLVSYNCYSVKSEKRIVFSNNYLTSSSEHVNYFNSNKVHYTDTYGVDILKGLKVNSKFSDIKKLFNTNGVINIYDGNNQILGDDDYIKTGDRFVINLTDLDYTIYLSVKGDVNGNGSINVDDVLKSYEILKNKNYNGEAYYKFAADVIDDDLKINDVAKLYQFANKKIDSLGGDELIPENAVIKSSTKTQYDYTFLEGIYPVNEVSSSYSGGCEMQVKETTSNTPREIYFEVLDDDTGEYVRIDKDVNGAPLETKGIKYINESKTDGTILIQWYYDINGVRYYTPIYKMNCTSKNSEFVINSTYLSNNEGQVNYKYKVGNEISNSSPVAPKNSILITTANYQVKLADYQSDDTLKQKVLDDIKNSYVFTAPHAVKQWRYDSSASEWIVKVSDVKTGGLCETMAKLTKSVCISRSKWDKTDPNTDDYADSLFQQLVVSIVDSKNSRLLVDLHGIANVDEYNFIVGTKFGTTLYDGDKCNLEKKLSEKLTKYANGTVVAIAEYKDRTCGFAKINNVYVTSKFNGGDLVRNVFDNRKVVNFSAVQLEIDNTYRTSATYVARAIDGIYSFVKDY